MTKIQMIETKTAASGGELFLFAFVLNFENLNFGFVSNFVLRASDLLS